MAAEAAKPAAYQIGAGYQLTNITTANDIKPITVINISLNANALFYNRLRLQIGADWWLQTIDFDDMEMVADDVYDNVLEGFPMIAPSNPQDQLTKLEGEIKGFDVPIMAEILLRPSARFNPYLGFGVVGRYYDYYKLEYYFNENGNPIYSYELKDIAAIQRFSFDLWQGKIGLDIKLTKHWLLNTELNYIKSYHQSIFGIRNIQQYGGKIGVKYQF